MNPTKLDITVRPTHTWLRTPALAAVVTLIAAATVAAGAGRSEAPATPPRAFAWKVVSPQGAIYVVGSVHLLSR